MVGRDCDPCRAGPAAIALILDELLFQYLLHPASVLGSVRGLGDVWGLAASFGYLLMKGSDIWGGEVVPGDFERPKNDFPLPSLFLVL